MVLSEMVLILASIGLGAGIVWGEGSANRNCDGDLMTSPTDIEKAWMRNVSNREFTRSQPQDGNLAQGKILNTSRREDLDPNTVQWARIIRLGLILTLAGGIIFLVRCL